MGSDGLEMDSYYNIDAVDLPDPAKSRRSASVEAERKDSMATRVPKSVVRKLMRRHGLKMKRVDFMDQRVWRVQPEDAEGAERARYFRDLRAVWRKYATQEDRDELFS